MKLSSTTLLALVAVLSGNHSAKANIAGFYLVSFHHRHPSNAFQEPLCVKIVEDGSTLGFKTSGTLTLDFNRSDQPVGRWFAAGARGATFTVVLDQGSASFITFSGEFGKPQIAGTSFVLFSNGQATAGGSFTAVKGACSF